MARNLRAKIAKSETMVINDVNDSATQKLVEEVGNVTIAKSVREVAEQTVCPISPSARLNCAFPNFTSTLMMFNCSINDQRGTRRS